MWIDIFGQAQYMKVFVSHFNIPQRVSTMDEALNNQIDKMTQSLTSATPKLDW